MVISHRQDKFSLDLCNPAQIQHYFQCSELRKHNHRDHVLTVGHSVMVLLGAKWLLSLVSHAL